MPSKRFQGRYSSLEAISRFVSQAAQEAGFDSSQIYAIVLAVDEACTNIIEHAYGGEGQGEIQCSYEITDDGLRIELHDWGRDFNPDIVPEPDFDVPLEKLQTRGAGLYFMRNLMDEVHFQFGGNDGNVLVMVKQK